MSDDNRKKSNSRDFGERIYDIVMDSVESMDFSGLSEQIRSLVSDARDEFTRQFGSLQGGYYNSSRGNSGSTSQADRRYTYNGERYGNGQSRSGSPYGDRQPGSPPGDRQARYTYQGGQRTRDRENPSTQMVVSERKLPGTYTGPLQIATGGTGLLVFGGMIAGIALTAITEAIAGSAVSSAMMVLGVLCIPPAIVSAYTLAKGVMTKNRVQRLSSYIQEWKDKSFIMLSDLASRTGQSLAQIRKDIDYMLVNRMLPGIRMDQEETCLLLTDEAISQYEAAKESQRLREEEEKRLREEEERWENASDEERDMRDFTLQAENAMEELTDYRQSISSEDMLRKLDRLDLLLSRIFVCVKEHPEKVRLTMRLMNYYLPSVLRLLSVYTDMEKQPIQGETIQKTREEIESSLDTINDALEEMFDELFQEEALDASADIQVLKMMLAQDGWVRPSYDHETDRTAG